MNATIPYPRFATRHDASAFDQCESHLVWLRPLSESREAFSHEIDHDSWKIVPSLMIEVYPELASTGTVWSEPARAPRH